MHSRNFFINEIFWNKSKNLTLFVFSNPVYFFGNCLEKQKKPRTNYQSFCRLPNMFKSFFFSDPSLDDFWWFNSKKVNSVVPKNKIDNLCKQLNVTIFPFLTLFWNVETLDKKKKNHTNLNTSRTKKEFQLKLKTFVVIFEKLYVSEI